MHFLDLAHQATLCMCLGCFACIVVSLERAPVYFLPLQVVAEAHNTLRQVARHRQLRSLLLTQQSLTDVAQQQLLEQTTEEGGQI